MTSGTPPTRVATAGRRAASASITLTGVPSFADGQDEGVDRAVEAADVVLVADEEAVARDPELVRGALELLAVGAVADETERCIDAALAAAPGTRAGRPRCA